MSGAEDSWPKTKSKDGIHSRGSSVTGHKRRSSTQRRATVTTTGEDVASQWLTAPINGADLTPLGIPTNISPTVGSAVSRARWSTTVPVKSLRSPASISTFSRKHHNTPNEVINPPADTSPRTTSTGNIESSSDSEKEHHPPIETGKHRHSSKQKYRVPQSPPRPEGTHPNNVEQPRPEKRDASETRRPERMRSQTRDSALSSHPRAVSAVGPTTESSFTEPHPMRRSKRTPPVSPRPFSSSTTNNRRSRSSSWHADATQNSEAKKAPSDEMTKSAKLQPSMESEAARKSRDRPTDSIIVETKPRGRSSSRGTRQSIEVVMLDGSVHCGASAASIPTASSRGRSSSRPRPNSTISGERSSSRARPTAVTVDHSRDRSSSRPRPTAETAHLSRDRSSSRPRPIAVTANHSRDRSSSRPRPTAVTVTTSSSRPVVITEPHSRDRSSGRPRPSSTRSSSSRSAVVTASHAIDQAASRARTSSTTLSHSRSRSTSRPRYNDKSGSDRTHRNRSRSASLTRMAASPSAGTSHRVHHHQRPPSTYRTRYEMRAVNRGRSSSESDAKSTNTFTEWTSGTELASNGSGGSGLGQSLLDKSTHKKSGIMEKLFGDQVDAPPPNPNIGSFGFEIRPRILLAATVYHNTATNLWITTINTNQRGVAKNPTTANKFLKAFSFPTECEARESAIANAPPKMVPFSESPVCFCCKGKFAVFRRASHCRNCGVCVCSSCTVLWPTKMIPATYNLKNEANVKICRSCNSLSVAFKKALLQGDLDEAIALYETGNVNLRTPFAVPNKKDEIVYPIHCAAEGGNINVLRWLTDDRYCPLTIHKARSSSKRGNLIEGSNDCSILTSKGRSVLSIAMDNLKVDMMRYLVVERSLSIYECKDLKSILSALEAALTTLPYTLTSNRNDIRRDIPSVARWDHTSFDDASEPSSLGEGDALVYNNDECSRRSRTSSSVNGGGGNGSDCIICFDRKINCVATPCGHQVCCLECSSSLLACPVCNGKGTFIRIFRP